MPTGYTAKIGDGSVTKFEDYALSCARNFSALIMMRDDPADAPIPKFKPSQYRAEHAAISRKELAEIEGSSNDKLQAMLNAKHDASLSRWNDWREKARQTRLRYEPMLEQARAYTPPTEDHQGLADFMVSQLEESIKWDCGLENDPKPQKPSLETWKLDKIRNLEESIVRDDKSQAEEDERTAGRNLWVSQLRESLESSEVTATG